LVQIGIYAFPTALGVSWTGFSLGLLEERRRNNVAGSYVTSTFAANFVGNSQARISPILICQTGLDWLPQDQEPTCKDSEGLRAV
jgi:hypothetical protein